jgi:hypothetical protein
MNLKDLTRALKESRAPYDELLKTLSTAELEQPGACGPEWSVKDVLSHLTAWEAEVVTQLAKARSGKPPTKVDYTPAETDAQNARWFEANKDRSLERVLADFQGVRRQLQRQLDGYADAGLKSRPAWLKGKSIAEHVAEWVLEHDREHLAGLQTWRKGA